MVDTDPNRRLKLDVAVSATLAFALLCVVVIDRFMVTVSPAERDIALVRMTLGDVIPDDIALATNVAREADVARETRVSQRDESAMRLQPDPVVVDNTEPPSVVDPFASPAPERTDVDEVVVPAVAAPVFLKFDLPPLNKSVLAYAENAIGKSIARGECWDLGDQALRESGAEPTRGYRFGDLVDLDEVMPGDILQFTSTRFEEGGSWMRMGAPHHTAVVKAVSSDGRLHLLHQNFGGKRFVTATDINPGSLTDGILEVFRPRLIVFQTFDLPTLNEQVLAYAEDNIGKRVARGECWDLGDQALRTAGAEAADGYTFGRRIDLKDVMPGDILQFTSARFDEGESWMIMGVPNHTAVVRAIDTNRRLYLLHQNVGGKRFVMPVDIHLDCLTSGKLQAFRPLARAGRS